MSKTTFAVLAPCAQRHELQTTHARMSKHQFARFKGALVFWCASCRTAHLSSAGELSLADAAQNPAATPAPAEADGAAFASA